MKYKIVQWDNDQQEYTIVLETNLSWEEANERLRTIRSQDKLKRGENPVPRTIVPMDDEHAEEVAAHLREDGVEADAEGGEPVIVVPEVK